MGSWRLMIDVRPGGLASLDEYTDQTWTSFEAAQVGARTATSDLRRRYPAANVRCFPTQWDGTFSDNLRPRAAKERTMSSKLGVISYFRGTNVWIRPAVLQAALDANGVAAKVPQVETQPIARAGRAAFNFRAGAGVKAEVVGKTDDEIRVGILQREKLSDREVRWIQVDLLVWSKDGGWSSPATDHGKAFVDYAVRWQTHVDYYIIRSLILDQLRKLGAFGMGGGGVNYVHADLLPGFSKLQAVVGAVPGATLYGIRLDSADPDTMGAVGDAALTSMTEAVEEVVGKLTEWREKAGGRKSSLDRMLADLGGIRERASKLATALRFSTGELEAAMDGAISDIHAALEESSAKIAEAPTGTEPKADEVAEAPKDEGQDALKDETETVESTVVVDEPSADDGEPSGEEEEFPSPEVLENGNAIEIQGWATRLGIALKDPSTRKRKSSLVLAAEIAALREARLSA